MKKIDADDFSRDTCRKLMVYINTTSFNTHSSSGVPWWQQNLVTSQPAKLEFNAPTRTAAIHYGEIAAAALSRWIYLGFIKIDTEAAAWSLDREPYLPRVLKKCMAQSKMQSFSFGNSDHWSKGGLHNYWWDNQIRSTVHILWVTYNTRA